MRKLILLLPLLSGCALLQQLLSAPFQQPTLAFKEARLPSIDFEGAELDLVFTVSNPNAVGLDLAKVSYDLQVEGKRVVAGSPQNGLVIPARGSAEAVFPARVRWTEIVPALTALFKQDLVHYKASGELGVNSPVGVVALPLSHEGTFQSPRMPKFDIGSPRITSLGFTGAQLTVPLKITNGNGFPLPLGGLAGAVAIAGTQVSRVALPQAPAVPAGQEATLQIPVEVNFVQAGMAVAEAIRSGSAEVKVDASLDAAGARLPFSVARTVALQR